MLESSICIARGIATTRSGLGDAEQAYEQMHGDAIALLLELRDRAVADGTGIRSAIAAGTRRVIHSSLVPLNDVPPEPHHEPRFIEPEWPKGPFNLRAIGGGFEIGPFTRDGFSVGDDGTLYFSDGSGAHPVTLRVRRQDGDSIDANNGDMGPMRYRIVPLDANGEPQNTDDQIQALDALLSTMSDSELARAWARCMRHLRERDLVRTANTPVGDYAERICCDRFGLERLGFSEKGIDAIGPDDRRYQIKARRLTPENPSRQLGAIRDIDEQPFDELLAVFFDEDLELQEIWRIPHEVVAEAKFVSRTNSTRFALTPKLQHDPRVERLV